LIECVLVTEHLVFVEVHRVLLLLERSILLSAEVLRPAARMIPMALLEVVFMVLVDHSSLVVFMRIELALIARIKAGWELAHIKISLSHLLLLPLDVEQVKSTSLVLWEVSLL